jgi:hypothetical protein
MVVLVVLEPDILEAPVENFRTILFTVGGTIAAAVVLIVMLRFNVPAVLRILVLWVPFAIVSWWLISPYFPRRRRRRGLLDFDRHATRQGLRTGNPQLHRGPHLTPPDRTAPGRRRRCSSEPGGSSASPGTRVLVTPASSGPLTDPPCSGSRTWTSKTAPTLRFTSCPAPTRHRWPPARSTSEGSRANVGDQTYDLPAGTDLTPGPYTALV